MSIVLGDDGTLDTVLHCTDCGQEFRYNFDPSNDIGEDQSPDDAYDAFVAWAIEDAAGQHEDTDECRTRKHGGEE